jgi:integrase
VRPYLAAHAFLLGGFTAFYRLGSFSRLTLARRVFGRDRVDGEIGRIRLVLAGWGYRLGRDDDQLLPMVACQILLLNRKMTRRAGIGHWHAHEGRHTAVSIMSSNGVPIQEISDTVGHKSTHVTETVYRHVIVPAIQGGATVMDSVFDDDEGD